MKSRLCSMLEALKSHFIQENEYQNQISRTKKLTIFVFLSTLMFAHPALAQEIDLSAVNSLLDSILNAMTGVTGRTVMTIVAVMVLLGGAVNFIDWTRVFTLLIIIVVIGVVPTVIQSIWGSS